MNIQLKELITKDEILEKAGYGYSLDREIYINRVPRKVFSREYVEDHTDEQIQESIAEPSLPDTWQFYFNVPPSDSVKRELIRLIG